MLAALLKPCNAAQPLAILPVLTSRRGAFKKEFEAGKHAAAVGVLDGPPQAPPAQAPRLYELCWSSKQATGQGVEAAAPAAADSSEPPLYPEDATHVLCLTERHGGDAAAACAFPVRCVRTLLPANPMYHAAALSAAEIDDWLDARWHGHEAGARVTRGRWLPA